MPHTAIKPRTRLQAQSMRRRPTDAERKLWYLLRSLKPLGFHFRRQAPIGVYIVDFVWYAGKLVVELDGAQHAELRRAYDDRRTAWLEAQGYRVLRFWNNDVLKTPRSVGEAILAAIDQSALKDPTPIPSPQGGGEEFAARAEQTIAVSAIGDSDDPVLRCVDILRVGTTERVRP
jgi:very-short-patch-repair endonuclease